MSNGDRAGREPMIPPPRLGADRRALAGAAVLGLFVVGGALLWVLGRDDGGSTTLTEDGENRALDADVSSVEGRSDQRDVIDDEATESLEATGSLEADDPDGDRDDGGDPTDGGRDPGTATTTATGGGEESHDHSLPATVEETPTGTVSPLASALGTSPAGTAASGPGAGASDGGSTATRSGSTGSTGPSSAAPAGTPWRPAPGTSWQWQLTGTVDTSIDAEAYGIDLFDTPQATIDRLHADGRTVICYYSAGAWEDWRPDAVTLDSSLLGSSNGWPGERWIDIRRMADLRPFIESRLDLAVSKGCDAVEPDNVDAYQNGSGFDLTPSDQIVFNGFLADAAHARGLSVGLKNAAELVGVLEPKFDWALVEECVRYDECESYSPFVANGKAVFHVEYGGNLRYCADTKALGFTTLEKDQDVGPAYRPCP